MAWLCSCLPLCIYIIAYLSCCHSSNLVSGSNSLQEYPIFTAVSTTENGEVWWGGGLREGLISHSYCSAVETVPFSLASAEGQITFLVPGQDPDFKPSLLEEGNCLRNSLLELVLYSCHAQELENIMYNLWFYHSCTILEISARPQQWDKEMI